MISNRFVKPTRVPWHVTIYRRDTTNNIRRGSFNWICGGTILSSTIVLTTEHCLLNHERNQSNPEVANFLVAAGEIYHRLSTEMDSYHDIQAHAIDEIVTFNDFSDIAVILLKGFLQFTESISPICIDHESRFDINGKSTGIENHLTGWGTSQNLHTLNFFQFTIESKDKECTGSVFDKIFCARIVSERWNRPDDRDRGSSLVFSIENDNATRYYLRGLLTAASYEKTGEVFVFTNATPFLDYIGYNVTRNEYRLREEDTIGDGSGCRVYELANGHISYYGAAGDRRLYLGDIVHNYEKVQYNCSRRYFRVGAESSQCKNGEWVNEMPECVPVGSVKGNTLLVFQEFGSSASKCLRNSSKYSKILPNLEIRFLTLKVWTYTYRAQSKFLTPQNYLIFSKFSSCFLILLILCFLFSKIFLK